MTSTTALVEAARRHRRRHGAEILAEFAALLAQPNQSRRLDDVAATADAITAMLRARRLEVRRDEIPGAAPVLIASRRGRSGDHTLGLYAHYDGQPVAAEEWTFGPWQPTLCDGPLRAGGAARPLPGPGEAIDPDWRLYARSAADDKAPIIALAAALDALTAARLDPEPNLVVVLDGEEEIGSPHLADYLDRNAARLGAAAWLICDGPVHQNGDAQIVLGVRGISELEITVYGPDRGLHSGHYGNWAPNPALELARLLASLHGSDGRVAVAGFYDGVLPPSAADRAAIEALPDVDADLRAQFGLPPADRGRSVAESVLEPSLNVRGLRAGAVGDAAANVVPARAMASLDVRLPAGADPVGILDRIEAHIRAQGYHTVRDEPDAATRRAHTRIARLQPMPGYAGSRLAVDAPFARQVLAAAAVAAPGPVHAVPSLGGSAPLRHFADRLGTPVVVVPFANHDNNQHAADENLRIGNLWYGIDLMAAMLALRPEV